jgi:catechol 2,3-dioxygenase
MYDQLLSQLAHVEIVTPDLDASTEFFTEMLGLRPTGEANGSVYLRAWGESFHHSLQLTAGEKPALGHIAWRAAGRAQLDEVVRRIEASGRGEGWYEDAVGHGRAYRFRSVGGHLEEVFWDVERPEPPASERSTYPGRPQAFRPRGATVRYLDHVTVATADIPGDVQFHRDVLGKRYMEYTVAEVGGNPEFIVFATMTSCERSHDLGLVPDFTPIPGRINHLAYWVDQRQDVVTAADVILEAGYEIEFGPGRHGVTEQEYLYFREPGGMRVEINSGGYRNYEPDYGPVKWTVDQGSNVFYRNLGFQPSMFDCFPMPEKQEAEVDELLHETGFAAT